VNQTDSTWLVHNFNCLMLKLKHLLMSPQFRTL